MSQWRPAVYPSPESTPFIVSSYAPRELDWVLILLVSPNIWLQLSKLMFPIFLHLADLELLRIKAALFLKPQQLDGQLDGLT